MGLGSRSSGKYSTSLASSPGLSRPPITRALGDGAVYWSDMMPSSIEQVVRRARRLGRT